MSVTQLMLTIININFLLHFLNKSIVRAGVLSYRNCVMRETVHLSCPKRTLHLIPFILSVLIPCEWLQSYTIQLHHTAVTVLYCHDKCSSREFQSFTLKTHSASPEIHRASEVRNKAQKWSCVSVWSLSALIISVPSSVSAVREKRQDLKTISGQYGDSVPWRHRKEAFQQEPSWECRYLNSIQCLQVKPNCC